ncbi:MAG: UPF0158 family protein [Rikenellaceae bacterium]
MKLSKEQIKSIAQDLECGMNCIINLDSGEYVTLMGESFDSYWSGEDPMLEEVEKKIESWENTTTVEPPYSGISFGFMEQFVDEVIPEGSALQDKLYRALSKSKPFRNFKNIVDCSDYREAWFAFKDERMVEYVERELRLYLEKEEE